MKLIKKFLKSKSGKRALWTLVNSLMAIVVSFVAYSATENVAWAVTLLPFAQALSQFITKELNHG